MPKTKAQILTLGSGLGLDLEDDTTSSRFFDDVVEYLALLSKPPFIKSTTVSLSDGTTTYSYEADMLRLMDAILRGNLLSRTDETDLAAYANEWQGDSKAEPRAYFEDWLARQYSLYPTPNFDSGDTLRIFYAEDRATNIQDFYALPIALLVAAREFSYNSSHQDMEIAEQCQRFGEFILEVLGHERQRNVKRKSTDQKSFGQ